MRRLTKTLKQLEDLRQAARSAVVRTEITDALARLGSCTQLFDRQVRDPPSAQFQAAARLARASCGDFEHGARLARAALERRRPSDLLPAEDAWGRAAEQAREANLAMPDPRGLDVLPVPAISGRSALSHIDPFLGRVATRSTAEVRCWAVEEWKAFLDLLAAEDDFGHDELELVLGFANLDEYRINLPGDLCADLATLAYSDRRPAGDDQLRIAEAVGVLAHEATHLTLGSGEARVECAAMQDLRGLAARLGASTPYAATLAERYWREVHPLLPSDYRSPQCRNGGSLDERPDTSIWP